MNETIKVLHEHASHRHYVTGYQIPQEHIDMITKALQQAPSWQNGQHYSVVIVDDQTIKDTFYKHSTRNPQIATCSLFLVFCMDLTTHALACELHNKPFDISNNPENLLISVTDTALAMQNAIVASESLGYGTVAIGGVRQMPQVVIDTLQLPKYVYPLCGLCIGKVDVEKEVEQIKPRFAHDVKIHHNTYKPAQLKDVLAYDETLRVFAEARETLLWSEKFSNNYSQKINPKTAEILMQQGLY